MDAKYMCEKQGLFLGHISFSTVANTCIIR